MTESQKFLLSLVRMALWGGCDNLPESAPDWKEVLALAEKQTLSGLVAAAVPMLPEHLRPDPQSRMKLHTKATMIVRSHSLLNRKVADLKTRMDVHGVHTVLFKGQGVALNYPDPLCRQCGDIDMYVGEKKFAKVLDLLKPDSCENASKYRNMKHFNCKEDGVEIEIHRIAEILPGIKKDRLFQEWTLRHLESPYVEKVEIGGATVNLPPEQFNALYIMNHAWHHFMNGGIGLRQLCDWTMFLHRHHAGIDPKVLESDLKDFGLTRAWKILAGVAVRHLGLPASECPLYSMEYDGKADPVMKVIWSEGNFGHHSDYIKTPRPSGHFAGKFHSFRKNTSRIIRIMSISPVDVIDSWISYFINGIRNVFVRVG